MFPASTEQLETLLAGAAEVIPAPELEARLARSHEAEQPLRVKLGIDPSRPDLHLGHAVVLRKLRQFQELGHLPVLIIGDFTGRVGDPSGQSETRPFLSVEEIEINAQTYLDQAGKVLEMQHVEVRRNSEWLAKMDMGDVLRLTSLYTVARMLERDDFRGRYREGRPISVAEFLYPLMQAMDSVAVRADVEMGGTDQIFNLLVGREIQKEYGQEPQIVFTMPLLIGTDGTRKMSKSFDNHVGLTEPPDEVFGKLMSIPDELIPQYFRLCTTLAAADVDAIERGLADGSLHPAEQKRRLAREIVRLYHGDDDAVAAEERFDRVHKEREIPEDVEEVPIPATAVRDGKVWIPRLLTELKLASSNSEARRLIYYGAVKVDGQVVGDQDAEFALAELQGRILQVGRRRLAQGMRLVL